MEATNGNNAGKANHWRVKRLALHAKVKEAMQTCKSAPEIAQMLGISREVLNSCLSDMGMTWQDIGGTKGQISAERARHARDKIRPQIIKSFDEGFSVAAISKMVGVSRTTVVSCLNDVGMQRPDYSEGNRRAAAKMTEGARKKRAQKANAVVRAIGVPKRTTLDRSLINEFSELYIGAGEQEFVQECIKRGVECRPQAPVDIYNIDILVGDVAVEIHNTTGNPHLWTRNFCRIIQLMRAGLHVLYIRTGPDFPIIDQPAMDEAFARIDFSSRNPAAPRQYWVIRGDGYVDVSATRQFNQFAAILMPERPD